MKTFIAAAVLASVSLVTSSAMAQYSTYYAPTPVVAAQPVYGAHPVVTSYYPTTVFAPTVAYRPAPVVVNYSAPVVTYRAVVPVASPVVGYRAAVPVAAPAPIFVGRPAYSYYSPYGGREVRVPGQPVRNFVRTVVP